MSTLITHDNGIFILDEADAMIDKHKLVLKDYFKTSSEIGGMVAVAQSKK